MERPPSLFVTDMLQLPFQSILDVAKKSAEKQHLPLIKDLCLEKVAWKGRFSKLSHIPVVSALDAQKIDAV